MLNKKTNNFDDFSRYYSEENQELLEKKSKLAPYLLISLLLILMFFSYLIYTYLSNQKKINHTLNSFQPKTFIKTMPSPLTNKVAPIEKVVKTTKPIIEKKAKHIKKEIVTVVKKPILKIEDKQNLDKLSRELHEIINQKTIIKKNDNKHQIVIVKKGDNLSKIANRIYGDPQKFTHIFKENSKIITNPNIIYIEQRLSIPIH